MRGRRQFHPDQELLIDRRGSDRLDMAIARRPATHVRSSMPVSEKTASEGGPGFTEADWLSPNHSAYDCAALEVHPGTYTKAVVAARVCGRAPLEHPPAAVCHRRQADGDRRFPVKRCATHRGHAFAVSH